MQQYPTLGQHRKHAMLERETELIKQIIIESTINSRDAIKLNDVLTASVPRGVKTFMIAETQRLLESEFQHSSRLTQVAKEIAPTVTGDRTLLRLLAMEYVHQRNEYLKLVEDTVHFLENYLCRPQWTLTQVMFEKEPRIPFSAMVKKFEYVVDYAYFGALAERYARRRDWTGVDVGEFTHLIERIDEEIVKQHSPREIAMMTRPIFEFLLFGDVSMNRPIPLGAIILFYEDKKMVQVKEYIERICLVRSRTQISMNELTGIIEDLYHVETVMKEDVLESEQEIFAPREQTAEQVPADTLPQQPAISPDSQEQTNQILEAVEPAREAQTDESNSVVTDSVMTESAPLDISELENNAQPPLIQPPPIVNADELTAYAHERDVQRHALFLTFPERTTATEEEELTASLPSINDSLTGEQRERFTKKVFKNDCAFYDVFIASIDKTQTWREAQIHLRELFTMNDLDILSPDVVEFTDALHTRYQPELKKSE